MKCWLWLLLASMACDRSDPAPPPTALASAPASTPAPTPPAPTPTPPPASPSQDVAPPDAMIAQHILVAYKSAKRAPKGVTRTKAEAKGRAQEARSKSTTGTAFEDLVKEYSDDSGSAARLGSLGKFRKTDMDPAFGAAAFALKVGEVSDVVETPFGFHVIKRTQ
jgi:hypothetical protein